MPFAVQSALAAHMADRVVGLMKTGERPGEKVLAEKDSVLPWFGPMLEASFGPLFDEQIAPALSVYAEADRRRGLVVDLGSGNGWYLRHLAKRYANLRGIGLDGFTENVEQARALAKRDGVADRLTFHTGDINHFSVDEPAQVIAMNRALHHVWTTRDRVFRILRDHLAPGGAAVIWEPRWPDTRAELRDPSRRGMAFQNLSEHVQGESVPAPRRNCSRIRQARDARRAVHLRGRQRGRRRGDATRVAPRSGSGRGLGDRLAHVQPLEEHGQLLPLARRHVLEVAAAVDDLPEVLALDLLERARGWSAGGRPARRAMSSRDRRAPCLPRRAPGSTRPA